MRSLKHQGMIDPSSIRGFTEKVNDDGTIRRGAMILTFLDSAEIPPAGTEVKVFIGLNGHFVCQTQADIETEKARLEAIRLKNEEAARRKRNQDRAMAEGFNSTITLPVKWQAGIKDVLSGLSYNSNGDARSKRTVHHILLMEDLKFGRISREKGVFLCGDLGKNWSNCPEEVFYDGDNNPYTPKITCKACLEFAATIKKRINKNS